MPPLWLAQLAQELCRPTLDDDVGVLALHLGHVREIVQTVGVLAAHRASMATMAALVRIVDRRGSCARLGSYDLLVFARTTEGGGVLELAEAIRDGVTALRFKTAERDVPSKVSMGCARRSSDGEDAGVLVATALRRLERAKTGACRSYVTDG